MTMETFIDGKSIWDYKVKELVKMKYDGNFSINEIAIIDDAITCKIKGGME